MLQRTEQKHCEKSPTFLALVSVLLGLSWPSQAIAQTALNLDQFRREHLITHGVGDETGNLGIYVSFPNWFGKSGYCPVRIRVTPRKGLQFKENGELKLTIGSGYGFAFSEDSNRQVVISIPIEAGKSSATKEVLGNFLLEENSGFDALHMKAKLNGRNLRDQQVYIYNARGRVGNDCKYLYLISEESAQGDSRRLEALKEIAETGSWYSQETHVSAVGYSVAFCNVRNLPPSWLHLSSLQAVSVAWDDLARMDAKSLETLNQYMLAGGHLSINQVASAQDVQKFLPIDLNAKLIPNRNLLQSSSNTDDLTHTMKNFEPPSLDFLEETSWDNYQRMTSVSFMNRRQPLGAAAGAIPRFPDDFYQGAEWLSEDMLQVGRAVLDMELARPIQLASYFYDNLSITKLKGSEATAIVNEKLPMLVSHGFGPSLSKR